MIWITLFGHDWHDRVYYMYVGWRRDIGILFLLARYFSIMILIIVIILLIKSVFLLQFEDYFTFDKDNQKLNVNTNHQIAIKQTVNKLTSLKST